MKTKKKDEIKSLLTVGPKRKYVHDLFSGKFYIDGNQATEEQFRREADNIMIDLGQGEKPEE